MNPVKLSFDGFATIRTCLTMMETDIKNELHGLESRRFFINVEAEEACRRVLARIAAVRRELEG